MAMRRWRDLRGGQRRASKALVKERVYGASAGWVYEPSSIFSIGTLFGSGFLDLAKEGTAFHVLAGLLVPIPCRYEAPRGEVAHAKERSGCGDCHTQRPRN